MNTAGTTATPIYRGIIDDPAAWTTASIGGKEQLCYRLTPEQLRVLDSLIRKTGHLRPQEATREDFAHPVVDALVADVRDAIYNGAGAVILQGVTRERYDKEQCERIYWGLGTQLGIPSVQNSRGDRLAHVADDKTNKVVRGYRSTAELTPHTDFFAVVGLMCLERAESGGISHLASALAIHNELVQTRPDLLEPLYRGTRYALAEARGTDLAVTSFNIPVFSCVDGQVSCFFSRQNSNEAVAQGVSLEPDFAEAAKWFEDTAQDRRFQLEFLLEPGEMMIWNNFVMLHSRTSFEDSAAHTRDLLRLWLNVDGGRPVLPELFACAGIYQEMFRRNSAKADAARTVSARG